MSHIVEALKALGKKITGTNIQGDTIADSISDISNKYTGGGSGANLVLIRHGVNNYEANMSFDEVDDLLFNHSQVSACVIDAEYESVPSQYTPWHISNDDGMIKIRTFQYYTITWFRDGEFYEET